MLVADKLELAALDEEVAGDVCDLSVGSILLPLSSLLLVHGFDQPVAGLRVQPLHHQATALQEEGARPGWEGRGRAEEREASENAAS